MTAHLVWGLVNCAALSARRSALHAPRHGSL